jgi:hypothetical protein
LAFAAERAAFEPRRYSWSTFFTYDSGTTWKAVSRFPSTDEGAGRWTSKTRIETGIVVGFPSALTVTVAR